jgi:hypothetical protein
MEELLPVKGISVHLERVFIKKELFLIYGEIVTCIGNLCTPGKGVH